MIQKIILCSIWIKVLSAWLARDICRALSLLSTTFTTSAYEVILLCCQSSKAFHATRGVFAAPFAAGLRQRDTAATVGGGWHQRDGQCAGHWWERFGRPKRCGKIGSSLGRSESRCIFKKNSRNYFSSTLFWKLTYPTLVGKGNSSWKVSNGKGYVSSSEVNVSADLSGLWFFWNFELWNLNCTEFELNKNTTWFWINTCQFSGVMSVTMESVDELRMRFLSSQALLCRKDGVESLLLTADQVGIHDQFTLGCLG